MSASPPPKQSGAASELLSANPTADIDPKFIPSLPNGPSIGALSLRERLVVQCPNEPNIIVAITSSETRKGEVGLSRFIPTHLICPFFDEPLFA
jgi:hypothetical protein